MTFGAGASIGVTDASMRAAEFFGLTVAQWQVVGVIGGLAVGVCGLAVNAYFGWRRDQREERARGTA